MNVLLKSNQTLNTRSLFLYLLVIFNLTFISYLPTLKADFVNWDDNTHLFENLSTRSLSPQNIKKIFTSTVSQVYIPLTTLSFAIEYHFFQYYPFYYHLNNLLLHIAVTYLIFIFVLRLGLSPSIAFMTTLFFGVHPMHVESVVWVTERKDVLFTLFYLLALINYLKFLTTQNRWFYLLTILCGILSMLSKAMAVSLPMVLLLLDWFYERKGIIRPLIEKIPFLLYSLPIAYTINSMNPGTIILNDNLYTAILIFFWTFAFYIYKFLFPYPLIPLYKTPEPVSLTNPIYICSLIIFLAFVFIFFRFRQHRRIIFCQMFYICSIFFLFRFDKLSNLSVVADRFIYLPSFGFCLALGLGLNHLWEKRKIRDGFIKFLFAGSILALMILTFVQSQFWQNSIVLWSHQIKYAPETFLAFNNRGLAYEKMNKHDLAMQDYNEALRLNPHYAHAYNNRGSLYVEQKKYDLAFQDYFQAIILYQLPYTEVYANLGGLYLDLGKNDLALNYINKAISIDPEYDNAYNSRGVYYDKIKNNLAALESFNMALAINPHNATSFNNRGVTLVKLKRNDLAFKDFNEAINIDPDYVDPYINRGQLARLKGAMTLALADFNKAIQLDPKSTNALNNRGLIYAERKEFDLALKDYNQILMINPSFIDAYVNRGTILGNLKQYEEAVRNYTKGINIDKRNAMLYVNRGAIYLLMNQPQNALPDFNQALTLDPKDRVSYYYRSICYKRLRNISASINDALKAKILHYPNIDAYIKELKELNENL